MWANGEGEMEEEGLLRGDDDASRINFAALHPRNHMKCRLVVCL